VADSERRRPVIVRAHAGDDVGADGLVSDILLDAINDCLESGAKERAADPGGNGKRQAVPVEDGK